MKPTTFDAKNCVTPFDNGNGTYSYGIYPQSKVSDADLIANLNDLSAQSNGWYLYNSEFYAKKGDTGWYKCDPIVWKILDDATNLALSTVLLDVHRFNQYYVQYYADSEIRLWLNDGFKNLAFLDDSYIVPTNVDGSNDDVFLLDEAGYKNADYGYKTSNEYDVARRCQTTPWARANGAYYMGSGTYVNNGYYWTRTTFLYQASAYRPYVIGINGAFSDSYNPDDSTICIRPAITLKIS